MKTQALHEELLAEIIRNSGKATQHTFLDNYLGNTNFRYSISTPALRRVAKNWIKEKQYLNQKQFVSLLTDLIHSPSSTEKVMAGILLDYANKDQLTFDPRMIDGWLDHVHGWAEVDTLCYGHFGHDLLIENWKNWKNLLVHLNKSKNISKRRASLVLLCKPLTQSNDRKLRELACAQVDTLKTEKEILITKAISWILRSMVKLHRSDLKKYLGKNKDSLPAIALRETMAKLKTGRKS